MVKQSRLEETRSARMSKRRRLEDRRVNLYPARQSRLTPLHNVLDDFDQKVAAAKSVTIAGRLMSVRGHGGSTFADLSDGQDMIQLFLQKDIVGDADYSDFTDMVDLGDILEISGVPVKTKTEQPSIAVESFTFLAKALTPLPEKYHGLADSETRARQRHLDLIANKESRARFETRSAVIAQIRTTLEKNGFLEVETPILQPVPGGASAKPFVTHHNELDEDLYLRIAPELYLKRLIVGGMQRVFEIGKCFRNEGIDHDHNPEFTQVEFYAAYWDYREMMKFAEKLLRSVMKLGDGSLKATKKFRSVDFREIILSETSIDLDAFPTAKDLLPKAEDIGVDADVSMGRGKLIDLIFKKAVRPKLIEPTFLIHHPRDLSPLAKPMEKNENYVERFQVLMHGTEIANGFSELNDPLEQRKRFEEQDALRSRGDDEAQYADDDYVEALMAGMPPTAGIGIGIDRLVALMTGAKNLKDVILFPSMRSKES